MSWAVCPMCERVHEDKAGCAWEDALRVLRRDLAATQARVRELEAQAGTLEVDGLVVGVNMVRALYDERDQLRAELAACKEEAQGWKRFFEGTRDERNELRDKLTASQSEVAQLKADWNQQAKHWNANTLRDAQVLRDYHSDCQDTVVLRETLATRDAQIATLRTAVEKVAQALFKGETILAHFQPGTAAYKQSASVQEAHGIMCAALEATPEPAILGAVRTMKSALEKMADGYVPADHCLDEQCCDACDAVAALADVARVLGGGGV